MEKIALLMQLSWDIFSVALVVKYTEVAWVLRLDYLVAYFWIAFSIIYCLVIGTHWGTGYYFKKRKSDKTDDRRKNVSET